MPMYEFVCKKCQYSDEFILPVKERNTEKKCPKCNGLMVRQISNPSFNLIGNGFYQNDYKKHKDAVKDLKKMKKERKERRLDENV